MPEEFSARKLAGKRFRRVDLSGAEFEQVDMSGARFNDVDLTGVRIRGALLRDVRIGGELESLIVNGIDVAPRIEAELDRRHPERAMLDRTYGAIVEETMATFGCPMLEFAS